MAKLILRELIIKIIDINIENRKMERGYRNLLLAVICALFSAWLLSGCTEYQRIIYQNFTKVPTGTCHKAIYDTTALTNSVIGFKTTPSGYRERNGYLIQEPRIIFKSILRSVKEIRKLNNNCDTVTYRFIDYGIPYGGEYIFYCRNKIYVFKRIDGTNKFKLCKVADWRDYSPVAETDTNPEDKEFWRYNKYLDMAILSRDPKLFKYILNIYAVSCMDEYINQFIFKGKKLEKVNFVEYSRPQEIYKDQKYNREKKVVEKINVEEEKLLNERLRRIDAGERLWETEPIR